MSLTQKSSNKNFGGELRKYSFQSKTLGDLETNINVFLPSEAISSGKKVPVLYYLAGLTCTEDNGAQKGGFQQEAEKQGIAIVFPDTSPRGAKIEGEDDSYDFGSGAGFYINATKSPWNKNYNMYEFITKELPEVLKSNNLPLDLAKASISGHSMGGHGALTLYLKNPSLYKSASAFAPICHPTKCPWGEKAFSNYLQGGIEEGKANDATELLLKVGGPDKRKLNILIDSGLGDNFYNDKQLLPEDFAKAAMDQGYTDEHIAIRLQEGYDHSYYFISTFAPEHVSYHAKFLKA